MYVLAYLIDNNQTNLLDTFHLRQLKALVFCEKANISLGNEL